MKSDFLSIGFGNAVLGSRIIAIITPKSTSGKRLKDEARESNKLIDTTTGRKSRSIIIMDSGHVILSALTPETLIERVNSDDNPKE